MSEEGDWMLIGLDEKMAKKQGLPAKIPVPRTEFEGLAENGLSIDRCRAWIKDFLTNSEAGKSGVWRKKNATLVSSLEAFTDKMPLWERAQKAFSENNYEQAITTLKRIATMDPEDHAARLNLASALANTRDFQGALKSFQAVRKTFEGDPDYHVALGHVHLALKDNDNALNEMVLALEAKPDCQPALEAMVQMGILSPIYENPRDAASLTYVRSDAVLDYLASVWDTEPRSVDYFLEQLAYHEREQRHTVALSAAERAIKAQDKNTGPARAEIGRISALRSLGRQADALTAANDYLARLSAEQDTPPQVLSGALVESAKCLAAEGKAEEGNAAIDRALAAFPGDLEALSFRFWPADNKDIQKVLGALPALQAFVDQHPESAGAVRSLARMNLLIGRAEEAILLFARAVGLAPDDDDLRAEYWSELGKLGRFEEIISDASTITNMPKRDWKLRWNEAEAYASIGKRMEARTLFSAINFDDTLHVDIRKRAKRAVKGFEEAPDAAETKPIS